MRIMEKQRARCLSLVAECCSCREKQKAEKKLLGSKKRSFVSPKKRTKRLGSASAVSVKGLSATGLPRNVPRKVIGEIRKKGERQRENYVGLHRLNRTGSKSSNSGVTQSSRNRGTPAGSSSFKRRIGMHSFSYEFDLEKLHKMMIANARRGSKENSEVGYLWENLNTDSLPTVGKQLHSPLSSIDRQSLEAQLLKSSSLDEKDIDTALLKEDTWTRINSFDTKETSPYLTEFDMKASDWKYEMFFDVLHLTKVKPQPPSSTFQPDQQENGGSEDFKKPRLLFSDTDGDPEHQERHHENATDANLADDEAENPVEQQDFEDRIDVFIFNFGSVVLWNFDSEIQELHLIQTLRSLMIREFNDSDLIDNANDTMDFVYATKPAVKHDLVRLSSIKPEEKLAVSYAFAQSNLLSIYEWRLDKIIERNEHIPQELALTGKMSLSQDQISRVRCFCVVFNPDRMSFIGSRSIVHGAKLNQLGV